MINYIDSAIFGIVQGLTEFLPVSSSGHLIILHEIIRLPVRNELAFDVILHSATLLAVILFFKSDILKLLKSWFRSFFGQRDEHSRLSWLIILATIPAALAGYFFEDLIEAGLRSPLIVAVMLAAVGVLLIVFEKISKQNNDLKSLNASSALVIGLAQAIALIPGTSRSGITIIAGLGAGLKREEAVRFSFLMSIPVIFGATIKKIPEFINQGNIVCEWSALLIAFAFAFVSGILAIKYFLRFTRRHCLNIFAYYRFVLAAIIVLFFYFFK